MYALSNRASSARLQFAFISRRPFPCTQFIRLDQNTRRDELWATVITASDDIFLSGQSVFCIMHWENVVKRYRQSHHSVLWTKLVDLLIIAVAISGLRLLISKYQVE